jgi:phenylalanyl-tRNA synthetase alpha chain
MSTLSIDALKKIIDQAQTLDELDRVRGDFLGRKGTITEGLKGLKDASAEEKKTLSAYWNGLKDAAVQHMRHHQDVLHQRAVNDSMRTEAIDVTVPAPRTPVGKGHPLMQVMADVIEIFATMGFSVRRGPDIETEFYNFDALNVHADHPARAEQDTFYLSGCHVLRTQTSPVQIRTMMTETPPLRIISPGRVYRSDHDRTHAPMFHQVEALVVEPGATMGHLKGCLDQFLSCFFGTSVQTRLRPSYFPFTEPSAEVDIAYTRHNGHLSIGQGDQWLEILGCGMVHRRVFDACHYPSTIQGFAMGMGLERLAMLKYGIDDLRVFFDNDQRWLDRYGFAMAPGAL